MTTAPRLFVSFGLLVWLGSTLYGQSGAQDTAALEDLERTLVKAIATKDLATYDRIVADDYIVVNASGVPTTKADVMKGYKSGERGYRDLEIHDVQAHVFGNTAVVSARTSGFRVEGGKEAPNRVRYLRVYARRNGRWRAVTQMSTPLPK